MKKVTREEAIDYLKWARPKKPYTQDKKNLQISIDMAIEALKEQHKRGDWVEVPKYKGFYVCSNCLKRLDGNFESFEHWEMKKDNFCSVCGSDNRKKGDSE